ncbi:hypothetical protein J2O08_13500 [Elizabethkingia anophelis]|uniref:helix-turn-helix transcriptional regulator n=1 Tax=Elizabethkingia anophelis TaxID=1117645 RepID=UPI0020B1F3FD|nr:hypothetical protein [Elizabethkingia anophelis]MCT4216556.1 hypothetical protein [Elizabethkingia anophelis]UTF92215.1 hypothetical protein J2O08_13500 [Elizabethkingia anophelis]
MKIIENKGLIHNRSRQLLLSTFLNQIFEFVNNEIGNGNKSIELIIDYPPFESVFIIENKTDQLVIRNKKNRENRENKTDNFQGQLNESFEEIISLAKKNSPHFLFRFKEAYPFFYNRMIEINPKIKIPELTFCLYLYLGFTTKEIANYTFVTIRGVETRRNRLRKKYNIPSNMDFSIWIDNYSGQS